MTPLRVKAPFKMLYSEFFLIGLLIFTCNSKLWAGAWVKESGSYYIKLSLSQASERLHTVEPSSEKFSQKDSTWHLYAETGLSSTIPFQLSIYMPYKIIDRSTVDKLETFSNKGIGDTVLSFKYPLLNPKPFFDTPTKFLIALSGGIILPTTSNNYRFSNEERRYHEVSQENQDLISGIDKGMLLYLLGLDSSIYWKALWLSLGGKILGSSSGRESYESKIDLGLGLPSNSWIQTSWSQLISKVKNSPNTVTTKAGIGLGWTAIYNVALELGYFRINNSDPAWENNTEMSLGLSVRTL